jgi:hypothetical protein
MSSNVTVNKAVTLTTAAGDTVTLLRPDSGLNISDRYVFDIGSGGKLTLKAGSGGELILTAAYTISSPFVYIRSGGELVLETGAKLTGISSSTAMNFSGVIIRGGTFTMTGGEISKISRHSGVLLDTSGSIFNMSGGKITGCNGNNGSYAGGVTVKRGVFTMSGTAEISGNNRTNSASGYDGGAITILSGASFIMNGGTISNNCTTKANGGGVYVMSGGIFKKTGGTIYGRDGGTGLWNRITNNPNPPLTAYDGQGAAVYCVAGSKFRDSTAGPGVNLDSGTAANWNQ